MVTPPETTVAVVVVDIAVVVVDIAVVVVDIAVVVVVSVDIVACLMSLLRPCLLLMITFYLHSFFL